MTPRPPPEGSSEPGTPILLFLASPLSQPFSRHRGLLRERVGAVVGAPGAPEWQRGCSGRAGCSKLWHGAGSLGAAQRVSPSPAAEAMTLSIQPAYGAMRV